MIPDALPPGVSLSEFELYYRGEIFGGLHTFEPHSGEEGTALQSLEGWDTPSYVSGDVKRAIEQGEFAGVDLSPGRDVTIKHVIAGETLRRAIAAVFNVTGQTEYPLYLQLPSGTFAISARPRKHNYPLDVNALVAGGVPCTSLLHATDPRWYQNPRSKTIGVPTLGGLKFPVTFPVGFGGISGGLINAENAGKFEMRPVLVIAGPCTNPAVGNLSLPGGPTLFFNVTLAAGDVLEVNTDFQGIYLQTAGSPVAESRRDLLGEGSVWWNILPGSNAIQFRTTDATAVAGTLTLHWADAFLGL